ncbi:hypothetical protein CMI37_13815 [Candidatus Pacearchaeota archaeon]|nr:hypothetical protein [Candidatus Pacearchaeota archaeon]|tara:strand:- start:1432 stop:1686 length:255 start_codon:yes stop_codon:yes gene_type:complete
MATRFEIRAPMWGTQKVGLAEKRMFHDVLEVNILYADKRGNRLYPHLYHILRARALGYPTQLVKGTLLRVIPIADMEEVHVTKS